MTTEGRPRVTVHYAQSLDGCIATRTGESRWISHQGSLELAHRLRAEHDAVLVGVGTVIRDDPQLTVRLVDGKHPLRIILDSTLRLPAGARLLAEHPERTVVATTRRADSAAADAVKARGAEVLMIEEDAQGRVHLAGLMRAMGAHGIRSVLIEGGAEVITGALRDGLVDRLVVAISPKLIGAGTSAIGDLGIRRLEDAVRFASAAFTVVADEVVFDGEIARPSLQLQALPSEAPVPRVGT